MRDGVFATPGSVGSQAAQAPKIKKLMRTLWENRYECFLFGNIVYLCREINKRL